MPDSYQKIRVMCSQDLLAPELVLFQYERPVPDLAISRYLYVKLETEKGVIIVNVSPDNVPQVVAQQMAVEALQIPLPEEGQNTTEGEKHDQPIEGSDGAGTFKPAQPATGEEPGTK